MIKIDIIRLQSGLCEVNCQVSVDYQKQDQLNLKTGKIKFGSYIKTLHFSKAGGVLFSASMSVAMAANPSYRFTIGNLAKNDMLNVFWEDKWGKKEKIDYIVTV